VPFAVYVIGVHLSREPSLYLPCGSREANHIPAARDRIDREPLLLEPAFYLFEVGRRHPEAGGKLIRSEPLMIERRCRILLGGNQIVQAGLLGRGSVEYDADSVEPGIGGQTAGIKLGLRQWVQRALHGNHLRTGDLGANAGSGRLRAQGCGKNGNGGDQTARRAQLLQGE
jgi:hypothetical protein